MQKLTNTIDKFNKLTNNQICRFLNYKKTFTINRDNLSGQVDTIDKNQVSGWIWNPKKPNKKIVIQIYDHNNRLSKIKAKNYRQDLHNSNIGNGLHSFNYSFPESIKNDKIHKIRLLISKKQIFSLYVYIPISNPVRKYLSKKYIKGNGIEIGALHYPLWTNQQAKVKYVDRMNTKQLQKNYPELNDLKLMDVDIIDNGEKLNSINNNSLDFIICNHMLEHCQNPLGTIRNHLKKIKRGKYLYYAVPNKKYTFDIDRKLTSFSHLIKDDKNGPNTSKKEHYLEWIEFVEKSTDTSNTKKVKARLSFLMKKNYSIHFHVWNENSFLSFIKQSRKYLKNTFNLINFTTNNKEMIVILKKN